MGEVRSKALMLRFEGVSWCPTTLLVLCCSGRLQYGLQGESNAPGRPRADNAWRKLSRHVSEFAKPAPRFRCSTDALWVMRLYSLDRGNRRQFIGIRYRHILLCGAPRRVAGAEFLESRLSAWESVD
jgi:hypothetical protein